MNTQLQRPALQRHRGAAAVEFALVCAVFFTLLIGAMEMGRMLFYWNTAVEATRLGARMAVVCSPDDDDVIRARMRSLASFLPGGAIISVSRSPTEVTVKIVTDPDDPNQRILTFIPFVPVSLQLPLFTTTLLPESMASWLPGAVGGANPVCN